MQHLAGRRQVIGVDIARSQLELSRARFPLASFVLGDLTTIAFRLESLLGVVCLFALFHVPRQAHERVLREIASWLSPGDGRLLITAGARDNPGAVDPSWLGSPMFWASFAPERFAPDRFAPDRFAPAKMAYCRSAPGHCRLRRSRLLKLQPGKMNCAGTPGAPGVPGSPFGPC